MDKFSATLGHGTGRHFESLYRGHFTLRQFIDTIKPYRELWFRLSTGIEQKFINTHIVNSGHVILANVKPHYVSQDPDIDLHIETVSGVYTQLDGGRYHDYNLDSTMYYADNSLDHGNLFHPCIGIEIMYIFDGPKRVDHSIQVLMGHPVIEITDRKAHA